ncbi:FAD-binding oxidoreductase [Streptomyces sp. R302]|uniref:FAD-binding and (Fe-S)-binding domain-containing protein n=1 Tax=unclassified Streptomyces TaxID=2593676 RepID=UPI00145F86F8|nr:MULTISPECIES: FAD-binding and (Fe-S)-binding domain-containing protein [unclassified Streptomyces]NML50113.1 FAD-binding oxidoreductase [Streptomyces sp. R301]NML79104.1 FAD-binding oxidoreductase [Streptomyces sp. R302]
MRRRTRHPCVVGTDDRHAAGPSAALAADLRSALAGDVDFGVSARALATMDASNYRRVPAGTVAPRDADDVAAALEICRRHGTVPVVPRGAGTSIGGQATGTGVVLDLTRHMDGLVSVDPAARTAVVRPGLVLGRLRAAVRPYGLTFGPDPSTHSRCTLGGMIGNNACGAHSVAWGTTADNVHSLEVVTYRGERLTLGRDGQGAPAGLTDLVDRNLALLRTGYPPGLPRRISGYALDALLPERGTDVVRSFVGSEGTLGVVTEATVRLVPLPADPVLVVLGYADETAAADAAAGLAGYGALTVEGMAADLVRGASGLPRGGAWLFCEVDGEGAAAELVRAADAVDAAVVRDPAGQRALWRIREDAAGTATRMPGGGDAWPGWEDCAVPPARLGAYLRDFRALLAEHGLRGTPYGHFGDGCVHVRIDFDLWTGEGVRDFRRFSEAVAELVVAHGGSLSGEHGDGKARAELLPRMYGEELVGLFGAVKDLWDPDGGMNPGMLVRPEPLDSGLRFEGLLPVVGMEVGRQAARCVGVAKCRVAGPGSGSSVMCPSFRATGEEKHSTRGRARLLHEMAIGEVITDGWRSEEVREALDLCLSCKGCRSDCPVGVDMAAYKAEFLDRHYAGAGGWWRRPRSHWTMGRLPSLLAHFGRGLNVAMRIPYAARLAGVTPERAMPRVAERTFVSWFGDRSSARPPALTLWPDTFTNHLAPEVGRAAVRVLEDAGLGVELPAGRVCCGLTYVSTGQLGAARRVMGRMLDVVGDGVGDGGGPVVVLEPSCAATLRTDLVELLPDDVRAARLAASVRTFAEALEELAPEWVPPRIDRPVTGQTHCHQHAVLGDAADRRLRERAGLEGELAGGCCGLAGNFGFEPGHEEVSRACAEDQLLPALRTAPSTAEVLADGFSCRTQIGHLTPGRGRHLAEVLAEALDGGL